MAPASRHPAPITSGVHCTDPYDASTSGAQRVMGPRSAVDPYAGVFPTARIPALTRPETCSSSACGVAQRRSRSGVEPEAPSTSSRSSTRHARRPGGEERPRQRLHYRRVVVSAAPLRPGALGAGPSAAKRESRAWKAADAAVVETDIELQGLMILAAKATTPLGGEPTATVCACRTSRPTVPGARSASRSPRRPGEQRGFPRRLD